MNLKEHISQQIKQTGDIPFVEYMQQALYSPEYGYYSGLRPKFGSAGDFITAPELSSLFGQTLANQCQQILQTLSQGSILEFGAGSGKLCTDILTRLEQLNCLPDAYYILEISGSLIALQKEAVAKKLPHLKEKVIWLESWPDPGFNGVIIANEVLDAMPVHRFQYCEGDIAESFVTLNEKNDLQEIFKKNTNSRLQTYLDEINFNPEVPLYYSEANLFIESWIAQCAAILSQGTLLICDYGFPRHEYYHPDRARGTLMCHYKHRAHGNPFAHPGEEDITAHVDFTQVAEAGLKAGFHVAGYTNQASFLLSNGILELLAEIPETHRFNAQQAVKQLLLETEMGELFKVMALTKHFELDLSGFQFLDKRASL